MTVAAPGAFPDREEARYILENNCKHVVHMRQQLNVARLGLIFGAGVSIAYGFPGWDQLVEAIGKDARLGAPPDLVNSVLGSKKAPTSKAQLLFQTFRNSKLATKTTEELRHAAAEMEIRAEWRVIVRDALYEGVPGEVAKLLERETYLKELVPVIRKSALTVTYNFDDTLERILLHSRSEDDKAKTKGYTTVWSGNIHIHARRSVIYHPNGYLPRDLKQDRPSLSPLTKDAYSPPFPENFDPPLATISSPPFVKVCTTLPS